MPAPRLPTTAARSCCSIPPGIAAQAGMPSTRTSWKIAGEGRAAEMRPGRRLCCSAPWTASSARSARRGRADRGRPARGRQAQRRAPARLDRRRDPAAYRAAADIPTQGSGSCGSPTARRAGLRLRRSDRLVTLGDDIKPAATPGEVSGVTLIGGEQVEVVDTYWLFANPTPEGGEDASRSARFPADDPWMNNILRPIIEGAGYRWSALRRRTRCRHPHHQRRG
jgi:hypothetical protein